MKAELPPRALIEKVIEAGRAAPSGHNHQTTHLIVITDPVVLAELAGLVKEAFAAMDAAEDAYVSLRNSINAAKRDGYVFHYNAPVLIVAANRTGYGNAMADSACALENMMIAANELDLGSCWINQLHWLTDEPAVRGYMEKLGLGEDETVTGALILGYPEGGLPNRSPQKITGNPVTWVEAQNGDIPTDVEVIKMREGTWRIEDGGVRFFLLEGKDSALLIDTGMNVPNARKIAESLTPLPVRLLNTHADRDHISGNAGFEACYMHPDEEGRYRESGGTGEVIPVRDGDELDLGDRLLKIIHLPGHTPGSIAVLDTANRALISGDPIQENGRIFMFGAHRNMEDYINSLARLNGRTGEFDEIWPSHAEVPVSPERIGDLIEGAQKILAGGVPKRHAQVFGHDIGVCDLGFTLVLCEP